MKVSIKTGALAALASAALVVPAAPATSATPSAASAQAPTAKAACNGTPARINGSRKCLRTGQFCSRSAASQYRRYGFRCTRGSDGRYRLRRS